MLNPALHKEANGAGLESKRPHEKHSKPSALQTQLCGSPQGPGRPRAARTNTSFETSKEPDHQPKKRLKSTRPKLFYTSQYFFLICCSTGAETLQNWCALLCLKDVGTIPTQRPLHYSVPLLCQPCWFSPCTVWISPTAIKAQLLETTRLEEQCVWAGFTGNAAAQLVFLLGWGVLLGNFEDL